MRLISVIMLLVVAACSTQAPVEDPDGIGTVPNLLGPRSRRARLVAPDDTSTPRPLIVLLHGFAANALAQDAYLGVSRVAAPLGAYVALPEGNLNDEGDRFWYATDVCCNYTGLPVDDVSYLRDLVHEAEDRFNIDPSRIYFMGHSNGGFMAYRMACEMADEVAGIFVLAGSDFYRETACVPSMPVSVMQVHGTGDELCAYDGAMGGFPSAEATIARWAERAGCDPGMVSSGDPVDWVTTIDGAETEPFHFENCTPGISIQFDRMNGAEHIPVFTPAMMPSALDWLLAQHR